MEFWCFLSSIFCVSPRQQKKQKMLDFPPDMVISWTLKMYFWDVVTQSCEVGKLFSAL